MSVARIIDLNHADQRGLIGSWLVDDVLIDCGPARRVPDLLEGLDGIQPRVLLLTHIHLDHAGAAGALVARWPSLEVWVHERGARHIVDPARLMESAYRIFGPALDELFGPMVPMPAENIHAVAGGERVCGFEIIATPGHASHHVSFLDTRTGAAYPGDIAGVLLGDGPVIPPTPPPDIDLVAWAESLNRLERWNSTELALPHFGVVADVPMHLERIREALDRHAAVAREGDPARYRSWLDEELANVSPAERYGYQVLVPPDQNVVGILRYVEKHDAARLSRPVAGCKR
jgi:glyoxylase-like metal-dependent hydrolase (beta-lactamase superfamily II)